MSQIIKYIIASAILYYFLPRGTAIRIKWLIHSGAKKIGANAFILSVPSSTCRRSKFPYNLTINIKSLVMGWSEWTGVGVVC